MTEWLAIDRLTTRFSTQVGEVNAVNGVSYSRQLGELVTVAG